LVCAEVEIRARKTAAILQGLIALPPCRYSLSVLKCRQHYARLDLRWRRDLQRDHMQQCPRLLHPSGQAVVLRKLRINIHDS